MDKSARASDIGRIDTEASHDVGVVQPKKHFTRLQALGLQFSVNGAPITVGLYLSLAIGVGGAAGYFWDFIVVAVFQLLACLAIAELASAIPHSSGKHFPSDRLVPSA